jgi:sec-independent protein translocase protein TatB
LFDLSITKLLILGLIGLMIFGPDQLPKIAAQAGRALRDLRRLADNARADLNESLGPEFSDFDFNDLNPRRFVRKHLLEDLDDEDFRWAGPSGSGLMDLDVPGTGGGQANGFGGDVDSASGLAVHDVPPFDADAT